MCICKKQKNLRASTSYENSAELKAAVKIAGLILVYKTSSRVLTATIWKHR